MKKQWLGILLSLATLCTAIPAVPSSAAVNTVSFTLTVSGTDVNIDSKNPIVVFPNPDKDAPRVIPSGQYGFRSALLLIFDASGKLIEAGGNLVAQTDGKNGCAQASVTVPAGGFMIGFTSGANKDLTKCYDTAFEGAVLYNATMSVIYDVHATYNASTKTLSVSYPEKEPVTDKTVKFLFVGNSTTYFNGTPIKFKGLCRAAGLDVSVTYCTFGSAYLSEFADPNHERGKAYRNALAQNQFDYVVFQDAGTVSEEQLTQSLNVLLPLAKQNGAKGLLYMRYADTPDGAVRYYKDYTAVGEALDMKVSPSAIAYRYCMMEKPEVRLFADDNAHHSKEGSYLIACTWLHTFMGVSPVGNSYTAELEPELVDYLQKVALRACETPFDPDEALRTSLTDEDGTVYPNVALGCSYRSTGGIYNNKWTDNNADGSCIGKFTDGVTSMDGTDGSCGCYTGKDTSVTINLGKTCRIKRITTDLFGNASWGIADASDAIVTFYISKDGKTFEELGKANAEDTTSSGAWNRVLYGLTSEETVEADYVRVRYQLNVSKPEGTSGFCWVSEINAFGVKPEDPAVDPNDDPSEATSEVSSEEPSVEASEVTSEASSDSSEKSGVNTGLVVGIAVVCVGAIGAVCALLLGKKKKK